MLRKPQRSRDHKFLNGRFVRHEDNEVTPEKIGLNSGSRLNLGGIKVKKIFGILVVVLAVAVATGVVFYQSGAPAASAKPESTEGGGRVSALKRREGAPVLLG